MIKDQRFGVYNDDYSSMFGSISNGCLHMESHVEGEGDFPDMEKHYGFSFAETQRLFELISWEELIDLCKKEHASGFEELLENNGICPKTFVI
jgi:hypothetical protein